MTINIISDIHAWYEFEKVTYDQGFDPSKLESADYLIIAGDIGFNGTYKKILEDIKNKTEGKFSRILYIRGNHDYWQYPIKTSLFIEHFDDRYLELVDGNCVFLGCTMWSPIDKYEDEIESRVVDYAAVPSFTPGVSTELYYQELTWLRDKYNYYKKLGYKIIIVTHHVPNQNLIPSRFIGDVINYAFTVMNNSAEDIKPDIWIHGHTHDPIDKLIDGVRYIRNPIGYKNEINNKTWYNKVIKI